MVEKRQPPEGEDPIPEESLKLLVFFPDLDKLNMQALKQIALKMLNSNIFNAIIVIKGST
jgi:hypothetical protein